MSATPFIGPSHTITDMRLDPKDFWDHVESLKQKDDDNAELDLWLTHGLPIYSNGDQLLREYDKSKEL